ncbi:GAK system ATP-grasp enzyme [Maridesulfovibrio frigidus]|uniref:GAK system ATP-grasp enzyme n=1 Tax=Maridesulfovibrio frigidus TaxID=340956 RepID=UPI0004E1C97B|nr:GAK system ATP-grasp enzyme [Maridesulfovibrio frigidus]
MKIGVIGIKDAWSTEQLAEAVARKTGQKKKIFEMQDVRLDLPSGTAVVDGIDLSKLDGIIIKKIGKQYSPDLLDRLEMLRLLEGRGVKIFSSPKSILRVLDRLSCTITLQLGNIPMPPTTITENIDHALAAVEEYEEAVFKPLYSTKARGMFVLSPNPAARTTIEEYSKEKKILYIQKTIDFKDRDLGIVFLGGEYLTTYARCKANGSWNTTTVNGGKYAPVDPPKEVIELARKAQSLFNLDFTCVDVALTDDGPLVFEVSAFGGFRGLLDARGIDAASLYADYAIERIKA